MAVTRRLTASSPSTTWNTVSAPATSQRGEGEGEVRLLVAVVTAVVLLLLWSVVLRVVTPSDVGGGAAVVVVVLLDIG